MNEKKSGFKISYIFVLLIAIFLCVLIFTNNGSTGISLQSSEVVEMIKGEYKTQDDKTVVISKIVFKEGSQIGYILVEGSKNKDVFPNVADYHFYYNSAIYDNLIEEIKKANISIDYDTIPPGINYWNIIYPILYVCFGIFLIYMIYKMISGANKNSMAFGKSRAKAYTTSKVRFDDVAGTEEEKEELKEIVEFLKNPKKFTELGARIPKGVLLVGRPGTGKTLLAKAVAGEANVPFISISGSDFVEMFVGVGASRVRDLFDQAKKNKPCIIFIDEIDAVGRQRGAGLGGGNDEREQTLNQLLVEMDGFEANEGIIVLAATNRSDVLDPALMRPGRFDRQIYVNPPDVKGREGILKVHARNKPLDESVDLKNLTKITVGFTGADIENMLNEAAILAAREGRPKIIMSDITEGINKVTMGPQKKSRLVTEKDRKITAYHEAGHAILARLLPNCDEVQEVSIIPRGNAGGYTMTRPENDNAHYSYNFLMDDIAMCMGGRLAEEIIFKDITSGASADINQATKLAHAMVYDFGMSKKIGFLSLGSDQQVFIGRDYQQKRDFSEKLAAEADDEIREILAYNYKRAKKLLSDNVSLLNNMANLLLEKETINKAEIDMLMEGKSADEIAKIMTKREEEQRQKEKAYREELERQQKIESYEKKVKEGQKLLAEGIITESEYQGIVNSYNELMSKLKVTKNNEEKGNDENSKTKSLNNKEEKVESDVTVTKTKSLENNEKVEEDKKEEKPKTKKVIALKTAKSLKDEKEKKDKKED